MEDILKYENRDFLYDFLINDYGLIKIEEKYDPKEFGNFLITLSANDFFLRYINDRSYLTIQISSRSDSSKWYDLSFVKNFICHSENIDSDDGSLDNNTRIQELNIFLRKEFDLISDLFNDDNYINTREKINTLLRQQFNQRFR